jgi:hypothetical protein
LEQADENEPWREPISPTDIPQNALLQNVPCHAISCFNQMSKLCTSTPRKWPSVEFIFILANLLAEIVQAIYAVNPPPPGAPNKRLSYYLLEERLDKFYLEIPEHLQIRVVGDGMIPDPTSSPPPHFFALHLMYWCSAILLHRPLYVSCPLVALVCRCLLGSIVYEENDTEPLFLNSPQRSKR